MAVPGTIQALIAAFLFGILFNTASTALVLYVKSQGSTIYRDGLRLVLILFFLASSSWALVEFLATLIDPSAVSTCQVAVVFSSLFDQLGRVFVEQYLAWAVPKGDTKTVFSLMPQILVFGRFFVGIAFTAVTRTQFKPTCAPISSIRAVSITSIALDGVIIGLLSIQAFSNGTVTRQPKSHAALKQKPARLILVGVALWWGTSVTSSLGLASLDLFYRTALPGIGLTVLVALVTILSQAYAAPREFPQRPDSPLSREARNLSSSGSADYPPSRYEDLKEASTFSVAAFAARTDIGRNIRRNDDGTFPTISRPMTAGSDKNGIPTQEQLFSTMNSSGLAPGLSEVPPLPAGQGIMKSASGRKAVSKNRVKAENLVISNPIFNEDENMQTSFKRIPTIDLAEAVSNERLRRERYAQRIPSLVAQRPAPRPPSPPISPVKGFGEADMTGELERSESTKTNKTLGGLSVEGNASSTATQLSPGVEAIRRRSPRQPEPTTSTTPFRVIRPGEPIRIPIPRPPERDQIPPPTKPEPVKTPLQRRPTTGLPSNPRAQTLKSSAKETDNQKTQTVMFVNNIVYSNPNAVGDIIQEATKAPQPPDSADSVLNRPRPIPRKGDKDRQVFPAEITPNHQHKRSKSSGSIVSRKSILQVVPGSPTGLPALPPIPMMASTTRAVPNNTNSMTVEEKMKLLYSVQSNTSPRTEISIRRRSSLPNLGPIPLVPQVEHSSDVVSGPELNNGTRASRGSKRSTARTSSLLGITVASQSVNQTDALAASFKSRDLMSDIGSSWLPGIPAENLTVSEEVKRRSSPVIPVGRQSSASTQSETRFGDEETMTNWGSVYSPVIPVSRQNARSTYIHKGSRNVNSFEEIPIMMVAESFENLGSSGPPSDSTLETSSSNNTDPSQRLSGHFHHRPGDDCPTFSARKEKIRPRKMPPPTPLLLTGQTAKRGIIVQAAEPSPIESPRVAYEAIQAQLRNFEKSDRDSVGSSGQRLALLANLEQEMGHLESKWQTTHENLARDSVSSIRTSLSRISRPTSIEPTLSRSHSQRSSFANTIAERRASRMARIQRGSGEVTTVPSSQNPLRNPEDTHAASQTKLPMEHLQSTVQAPEVLMKRIDSDFLPTSKVGLGDPSPPETDTSGLDGELEKGLRADSTKNTKSASIHKLWSQKEPSRQQLKSWLWAPKSRELQLQTQHFEPPERYIRLADRKLLSPLTIMSSDLWQNGAKVIAVKPQDGLWNNQSSRRPESGKVSTRPATIRPPRKPKRVTLLPDIIENPEPLPNKRGTLGIFQFPWGEKSENATLQYYPSQAFMAMPGTMTTGNRVEDVLTSDELTDLEADEYSSSFFDDYEEGDNFSDFSGGGDDEFDETTLWEIASLLQTDQVPSKNSLLPMPLQSSPSIDSSILVDYAADLPSDYEEHDDEDEDMAEIIASPNQIISVQEPNMPDDIERSLLWTSQNASLGSPQSFGLPQHDGWNLGRDEQITMPPNRVKPQRLVKNLISIKSSEMWSPMRKRLENAATSSLWACSTNISELRPTYSSTQPVQIQHQPPMLWSISGAVKSSSQCNPSALGLPEPDAQVWQQLISQTSIAQRSRPRTEKALPIISSYMLWSQSKITEPVTLWTPTPISPLVENDTLFEPRASRSSYRTTEKPPAAQSLPVRAFRPDNAPLELLESTALWSLKVPTSIKPSSPALWEPAIKVPQVTRENPVTASTEETCTSSGLWRRPGQIQRQSHLGLFDSKATRFGFRRTSKPPAATSIATRPRIIREDISALTSRNLWARQQIRATIILDREQGLLWQGILPTDIKTPTLFKIDAGRTDYRTTSASPAALVVDRKPRAIRQPLQALQSTQLWANEQASRLEIDWIAVHNTSSSSVTPSTDRVPVEIVATEVSNATTPSKGKRGFFNKWFGKKANEDAVATGAAPKIQPDVVGLRYGISEPLNDIIVKDQDETAYVNTTPAALRHRYRPTVLYNADWDAELAEAIALSYPGTVTTLRASYPKDWDAQLSEAIRASRSNPRSTPLRATPRDWSRALHQAIIESYPHLRHSRGQTLAYHLNAELPNEVFEDEGVRPLEFDAAIRHPVFLGSLETTAETVHPAFTGYRANTVIFSDNMHPVRTEPSIQHLDPDTITDASPDTSSLWAKPLEPQTIPMGGLWTFNKEALDPTSQHMRSSILTGYYPTRGNKIPLSMVSDREGDIKEQGLWNRSRGNRYLRHPSSFDKNWLEDSVNKRFTRIELRY
ncbi:hypothetical protein F5Y03DRAFT_393122 [Xylaria venustula]|nr:hypothetical protein F5Y03DRAFT_393122 [Xylaria venustula]